MTSMFRPAIVAESSAESERASVRAPQTAPPLFAPVSQCLTLAGANLIRLTIGYCVRTSSRVLSMVSLGMISIWSAVIACFAPAFRSSKNFFSFSDRLARPRDFLYSESREARSASATTCWIRACWVSAATFSMASASAVDLSSAVFSISTISFLSASLMGAVLILIIYLQKIQPRDLRAVRVFLFLRGPPALR